jgi:hypothetical protein
MEPTRSLTHLELIFLLVKFVPSTFLHIFDFTETIGLRCDLRRRQSLFHYFITRFDRLYYYSCS